MHGSPPRTRAPVISPFLKTALASYAATVCAAQPGRGLLQVGLVKLGAGAARVTEVRSHCRQTPAYHSSTEALCQAREHREAVVPLASLPNTGGSGSNKKNLGMCRQGGITRILMRSVSYLVFALPHPPELPVISRVVQEWVSLLCARGKCLMVGN